MTNPENEVAEDFYRLGHDLKDDEEPDGTVQEFWDEDFE